MKTLLTVICILTVACTNTNNKAIKTKLGLVDSVFLEEGFDTTAIYEPSCLHYKGKPLFVVGQDIKQFDTSFSLRYDPNGKYEKYFPAIKDYLSLDDFYSAELSTGSIVGALYFSADSNGHIFKFAGDWSIDGDLVDTSGMEIMSYLHNKYFPCLPPDFKGKQTFKLTHKNFIENFKLHYLPDTSENKNDITPHWSLNYSIMLTKKKNGM
jgi:hypothetical protein